MDGEPEGIVRSPIECVSSKIMGARGSFCPTRQAPNGGVHRGPDRQLRINALRGLLLEAMVREDALSDGMKAVQARRSWPRVPSAETPRRLRTHFIASTGPLLFQAAK